MRILFSLIIVAAIAMSCKKDNASGSAAQPVDTTFNANTATLLKTGTLAGAGSYRVSGTVKLYSFNSKNYIQFTNFSSSNGPDLKVYIATTTTAAQFVSLGTLQSTSATTQTYVVNNPPDFNTHNKVLIWCQQFSVLFGSSTLQ